MSVQLISYTTDVDNNRNLLDIIAFCARVSNPDNQNNKNTSSKLIKYLIDNKHWSPFEMVNACVEITTTRDIARQILRHRSFSFQEFSQRYANPTTSLQTELREARLQDTKNRQNSIETDNDKLNESWMLAQQTIAGVSLDMYKWAIDQGIAKEQARALLPEGLMQSKLYMNGTIRSWIHYIQLRTGNGTQKEHRDIARQCASEIAKVFPMIEEFVEK